MKCIPIIEYARAFYALEKIYDLPREDAIDLLYQMNTANLDSCRECNRRPYFESSFDRFKRELYRLREPHHTFETLYVALERMMECICMRCLTDEQRDAFYAMEILVADMYNRLEHYHDVALEKMLLDIQYNGNMGFYGQDSHHIGKHRHGRQPARYAG